MKFNCMMHVSFFTDQMDVMRDFYDNKLGGKLKVLTKYKAYLHSENRPAMKAIAEVDPERVFSCYIELAPGQFIELFPKAEGQGSHDRWNENLGYSHYALTVDDIYKTREELLAVGITPDTEISKGPSGTYQMWVCDPDGNKFEIMQYTEDSYQVKGHID